MGSPSQAASGLPWAAEQGENQRFYVALAMMFIFFLPPALLIPAIDLPEPDRTEVEKIPPQLARLVEQKKLPEPVIPDQPEPKPEPEKERTQPEQKPVPEVATEPKPAKPAPKPEQTVEQARETASRSGLMAMKDTLSSMRSQEPKATQTLSANINADNLNTPTESSAPSTAETLAGSGGVKREQGPTREVAVAEHQVRNVDVADEPTVAKAAAEPAASGSGTRAMSNIRRVFDANKTALDSLYRRELRQDPTLQGRVTLKLVIEPDGSVSKCEVVDSELRHSKLEQRIAMRVRLFNFGSANVEQRELTFPLDFLPG